MRAYTYTRAKIYVKPFIFQSFIHALLMDATSVGRAFLRNTKGYTALVRIHEAITYQAIV
jgi:hypothetical protein